MFRYSVLALMSLCLGLMSSNGAASPASGAIADSSRPEADRRQDVNRKPVDVLAFIGLKAGDRVADFIPGGGYYTRLFSKVVGSSGRVYAIVPQELFAMKADADAAVSAIAADPAYVNVKVLKQPVSKFTAPEKLDVVWTSMNYHDLRLKFLGPADVPAVNKAIFDALKPGGVYVVLDHAAEAGSGARDAETLHRIDPEMVKNEVLAAGFVLDAESNVLRNPDDKHTAKVFDAAIRGNTDKFLFKFRKPVGAGGQK